jgi:SNF2 family DNA or RNA helicase
VEGFALDVELAVELLMSLPDDEVSGGATNTLLGDDLRYWIAATRFGLELAARQRFLPSLYKDDADYRSVWRPAFDEENDAHRRSVMVRAMPPACRALAWDAAAPEPEPATLLDEYLAALTDVVARQAMSFIEPAPLPPSAGPRGRVRRDTPAEAWVLSLAGDPVVAGSKRGLATLHAAYQAWSPADGAAPTAETFRVCFRLIPPPDPGTDGSDVLTSDAPDWTLEYVLQATDDPSLLVPSADVWVQRGARAHFLDRRFDNPQEHLLAGLGKAARLFPPIEATLYSARPECCRLTTAQAHDFIRETALIFRRSGFGVLIPNIEARLGLRVRLGKRAPSTSGVSSFGWNSLVQFDWEVALGNATLSRADFEELARLKEPLVRVRGQWIELRSDQIDQALKYFQRRDGHGEMPLLDALKLSLAPNGEKGSPPVEVATDGWIDDLLRQMRVGGRPKQAPEPPGFVGTLRPYQRVGVAWLAALRRYGLGACLADDMGLGKTIQLIALMLHEAVDEGAPARGPVLLVCPTSVVGNWRREVARFAPSLRVLIHHGTDRTRDGFAALAKDHDLVISSYALLPRDEIELTGMEWEGVILDEAQNIKNPSTNSAQVARKLRARWRTALTGTPVENRLSELWSIFQFLNPGYLGSAEEFRRRFSGPIERTRDASATARLKALISPFMLRRVKTDRSIIDDLPEKNEMKVFCTLTPEQATLYEAVLKQAMANIETAEGIERRGQILATITKLKQVCNHPALFLHDQSALGDRSGKLARLGEMLEEVVEVGDRALVFTQYAEMGRMLQEHLAVQFRREVLFLHGGTPAAERDRMVERFQRPDRGPQLFILSIKAGGTGLNLTRANHVFHFDRWWNPAVENQATDRAFRIGQRRDVQVHKFVSSGSFEEVLDGLIERKIELAQAIVGTGEAWITEMSTDELRDLFALRRDAVGAV